MGKSVSEVLARAKELNARVKELNSERDRKLGEKEAAERSLKQKLKEYNEKYGCDYSVEELPTVYKTFVQKLSKGVKALEEQIEYIDSGAYLNVQDENKKIGIETPDYSEEEVLLTNKDIKVGVSKVIDEAEKGKAVDLTDTSDISSEDTMAEFEDFDDFDGGIDFAALAKNVAAPTSPQGTKFTL